MVTEERVEAPTGEQVQGDSPAAPEPTPPAAAEPDYKALVAQKEAELATEREEKTRLKSRLDGLEGTTFQRASWERAVKTSDQKMTELTGVIEALVLASTDSDEHPARKSLAAYKSRTEEERAQAALKATINQDWTAIIEAVADAEGKKLESDEDAQEIETFMRSSPTWRNVHNLVAQGNSQANPELVRNALFKTWKMTTEARDKRHKAELDEERKKANKTAEDRFQDMLKQKGWQETVNPKAAGVPGKGRKPTAQEVHDATPEEYAAKKKSGEWLL